MLCIDDFIGDGECIVSDSPCGNGVSTCYSLNGRSRLVAVRILDALGVFTVNVTDFLTNECIAENDIIL